MLLNGQICVALKANSVTSLALMRSRPLGAFLMRDKLISLCVVIASSGFVRMAFCKRMLSSIMVLAISGAFPSITLL
ncbi:hypothetical protein D3C80_1639000 [compost metagenome]